MFDKSDRPRVFAQAAGVDFPHAVVDGLRARMADQPPEAMARVTLFVNTTRMAGRLSDLFDEGPATLLPRIRLITALGQDTAMADLPPAVSPLRRRLELSTLVAQLLDSQPDLAPRAAIYPLADSLAALMDEMQGEGVDPEALRTLDVSAHSAHWVRSLAFLKLVERFFGEDSEEPPDLEARQRQVIERFARLWAETPPKDPVIVAGSTGSRGATQLFMQAVATLPQGALILPGYDFHMPGPVWSSMEDPLQNSDHPQFRYRQIMTTLGLGPEDITPWHEVAAPAPRRNAFVSLALRPAPVTDQWQAEGPGFQGIEDATKDLTLIEAPSPRAEAAAIAMILRKAAEAGRDAALITPDRTLTRQVTAALDRWQIRPDDSAGRPLPLTAPGRLLRHVSDMRGRRVTGVDLLTLLKHPLTHSGAERGNHLRLTRDLELQALRRDTPFPDAKSLGAWAEKGDGRHEWVAWIVSILAELAPSGIEPLDAHINRTLTICELLAAGSCTTGSGALWEKEAGRKARDIVDELVREAAHGGEMSIPDFRDLFTAILNRGDVRETVETHPNIRIWGTLEARVQGVDLAILAGLNEGSWPERPGADPWMNRDMRKKVGLLLPERGIGLSAHDFQQAIGVGDVVLTRCLRDDEAKTVPSRWINRMTNLLAGMSEDGDKALQKMRARGEEWLTLARRLDTPQDPAHPRRPAKRPAPQPPEDHRPKDLSFTDMARLIRDPYAIYARRILGLAPLDPLHQEPDAALRGTAIHDVMERFIKERVADEPLAAQRARLLATAREVFEEKAPWPAARIMWLARLERSLDTFLADEAARQGEAREIWTEQWGEAHFGPGNLRLYGRADRIDRLSDGRIAIYDYKTGALPSKKQQLAYDKQLLLEALVARHGGFTSIGKAETAKVAYVGLGSEAKTADVPFDVDTLDKTEEELVSILAEYAKRDRGYKSRRVVFRSEDRPGDFDHLARFGEWDHADDAVPEKVGD